MTSISHFLLAFLLGFRLYYGQTEALETRNSSDILGKCDQIAAAISGASQVYFPPTQEYSVDISHYASSSSEASACSVEPGSAEDVGEILRILGSTRTPFGVKGAGHATNPGFSSTRGVEIALSRFNLTKVNYTSGTVEVGAGLTWGQVYAVLEPTGVNVVGGRAAIVGVSGLTLGGGYSYKTSQYGLGVDNVVGYELVLPNGTVINVTSKDEDLWFGLRGGMNNFGIVTKFILKSHPQSDIWAGTFFYEGQLDAIKDALFKFQQKSDTKAAVIVSFAYGSGQISPSVQLFYDAPTPPSGVFDDFLAIPSVQENVTTSSFSDLIQSQKSFFSSSGTFRNFLDDIPLTQYSPAVFDAFADQIKLWQTRLSGLDKAASVVANLEPFGSGFLSHGRDSAYPPDRSHAIFPSVISVQWSNASLDDTMAFALRSFSESVRSVALRDGQNVSHAAKYPNYALFDTPLEDMYGGNVERLRKIRAAIDPEDVMGLTGGWRF